MESTVQQEKNENALYLESNELNKLMETLMNLIRAHKPEDIVRIPNSSSPHSPASWPTTCGSSTASASHVSHNGSIYGVCIETDRKQYDLLKAEVKRLEKLVENKRAKEDVTKSDDEGEEKASLSGSEHQTSEVSHIITYYNCRKRTTFSRSSHRHKSRR